MKILLINPPTTSLKTPNEQLSLAYLASVLRREGHYVKIIDFLIENRLEQDDIIKIIRSEKIELIGITIIVPLSVPFVKELTKKIKEKNKKCFIFCGGYEPTLASKKILKDLPAIDGIIVGEGEITFKELVNKIDNNKEWKNVNGIYTKSNPFIKRKLIEKLNEIPFPARDYAPLILNKKMPLQIYSSRGCYNGCIFCSIYSFYNKQANSHNELWRARSAENIVEEIEYLIEKYNIKCISFTDDNFLGPYPNGKKRAENFYTLLKEKNLDISFRFACRMDNCLEDLMIKLKSVGLKQVLIGAESANQNILDFFNKKIKVKQNFETVKMLKRIKIDMQLSFIWFTNSMTLEELKENIKFVEIAGPENLYHPANARLRYNEGTILSTNIKSDSFFTNKYRDYKMGKIYYYMDKWVNDNRLLYKTLIRMRYDYWNLEEGVSIKVKRMYKIFRQKELELIKILIRKCTNPKSLNGVFLSFVKINKNIIEELSKKSNKLMKSIQIPSNLIKLTK
ncbi:radical SAM protein [Candidatus Woesearchaeota archaeon]|nr:radical SAM protein [Candidatus Woesearchaeota archaeon]